MINILYNTVTTAYAVAAVLLKIIFLREENVDNNVINRTYAGKLNEPTIYALFNSHKTCSIYSNDSVKTTKCTQACVNFSVDCYH